MLIEQLFDAGLGHASYVCADPDSGVAFVVDPGRDAEEYLRIAARLGVLITHSFETHVHNDYISGSRALAELRPIEIVAPAMAGLGYGHRAVSDGDVVRVGELEARAVATPGHTPEHMSWLVADLRRAGDPQYLFSGGALLVGHIARVDLLGPDAEPELARAAYATVRERILTLPDHLAVFPTHGGGSACSAAVSGSRWTTLGFERRHNAVVRAAASDFSSFHRALRHELPAMPAYYPHVRERNRAGEGARAVAPLRQHDERTLADATAALIDPRPPHLFGRGYRRGALNVVGSDGFGVRVGATVSFGTPIVLLTGDPEHAERLRRELAEVGYDEVMGYAPPAPPAPADAVAPELAELEQLDPAGASRRQDEGDVVVDVRETAEWAAGHVPGAIHIPYPELRARSGELPAGRAVVTYCESGVRSSLAASLLAAEGRTVRHLRGGFAAWRRAGREVAAG